MVPFAGYIGSDSENLCKDDLQRLGFYRKKN